jgi:hypothetical protein
MAARGSVAAIVRGERRGTLVHDMPDGDDAHWAHP